MSPDVAVGASIEDWLLLHRASSRHSLMELRAISAQSCPIGGSRHLRSLSVLLNALTWGSSLFPTSLRELKSAPPVLWMLGDATIIQRPAFSLCGSRHATPRGIKWAKHFGEQVAKSGAVLVTGLARGVDQAATMAAIEAEGTSIGVLAEGFERWQSKDFESHIAAGRLVVVSEFRPDASWSAGQAMQRNTTICALGQGLFVIEAGATGGTLAAGRTALRAGVPLYAVKYPQQSVGNEILIREGARPLERNSELLSILHHSAASN